MEKSKEIKSKQKRDEYYKKWLEKNKEKVKEYKRLYEKNNRERLNKLRRESPRRKEYRKEYYEKNKQSLLVKCKQYRDKNKEAKRARDLNYYRLNKDKIKKKTKEYAVKNAEKIKEFNKTYRSKEENKIAHNAYKKLKRDSCELTKLKIYLRNRTCYIFKHKNISKAKKTMDFLGLDIEMVKKYIESKFSKGMNWENYGVKGWHIDHIIPLATAKNEEDLIKLCHYTNLQPLWETENLIKGAKIINPTQIKLTI